MADSNTNKVIDIEKVKECAAKITALNDSIRNTHLADFEVAITSTTSYSDEAATELMNTFNELKPTFDTHFNIIKARADYLTGVAERHETIVSGHKQTVSGLKKRD